MFRQTAEERNEQRLEQDQALQADTTTLRAHSWVAL